ncbi:response regulator [Candidatus Dojkabacteria bacterium]|uniref:Response regulator n=1 Tax=Candidatus Dojkabacteria bacterium TaxID=2099670 RepID=A0A952DUK5_9BACT|nr:response regulator [Candidatus Dojkabacteria bacterium]
MKPYSILIVEDEAPLNKALVSRFLTLGYTVYESNNGTDALRLAFEHKPTVILLDLNMPKMDGVTFLEYLREDSWGKNALVLVLTNLDLAPEMIESLSVTKPAYYLVKAEWELTDIVTKVEEIISTNLDSPETEPQV